MIARCQHISPRQENTCMRTTASWLASSPSEAPTTGQQRGCQTVLCGRGFEKGLSPGCVQGLCTRTRGGCLPLTEIKINQSNFPQTQRPHIQNASSTDKITWFTSIHNHWSWHLIYVPARQGGVGTTNPGFNWEESQGIKRLQSFCSWQGWTRQNPRQHPPRTALLPTSFNNCHCS